MCGVECGTPTGSQLSLPDSNFDSSGLDKQKTLETFLKLEITPDQCSPWFLGESEHERHLSDGSEQSA